MTHKDVRLDFKAIGRLMAAARIAKGLSQDSVAEMLDVDRRQIIRLEKGESLLRTEVFLKCMILLNVPVSRITDDEESSAEKQELSPESRERIIKAASAIISELDMSMSSR